MHNKSFTTYKLAQVYSLDQIVYLGEYDQAVSVVNIKGIGLSTSTNTTEVNIIQSNDGLNWTVITAAVEIKNDGVEVAIVNNYRHLAMITTKLGATSAGDFSVAVREA